MQHPFSEIGSLSIMDNERCSYDVDRLLTLWEYDEVMGNKIRCNGPYQDSFYYYTNLLHSGWLECQEAHFFYHQPDIIQDQWNIHALLCLVLRSYVKSHANRFFFGTVGFIPCECHGG